MKNREFVYITVLVLGIVSIVSGLIELNAVQSDLDKLNTWLEVLQNPIR